MIGYDELITTHCYQFRVIITYHYLFIITYYYVVDLPGARGC